MIFTQKVTEKTIEKLNAVYSEIPETTGCMDNIAKENGCGAHCCRLNNPSVLYIEFQNSLKNILKTWSIEDILDLFKKTLRNYLSNSVSKSCIFWDKDSKLCKQHEHRPYACYLYGITPKEEFEPKYLRLKVLYKDNITANIKDQCNLIKTKDGSVVTKKQVDKWWEDLKNIEKGIGFKNSGINDDEEGSYKTFHDHLLLHFLPNPTLIKLTNLKMDGSYEEKELAILTFMSVIRKQIENRIADEKTS